MGKNYVESAKLIDKSVLYTPQEALELAVKTAKAKFDETIELHVKLGVDPRHADQQVRGAVVLPHGTGKTVKVLVFAKGAKAAEAEAAGAAESARSAQPHRQPDPTGQTLSVQQPAPQPGGQCGTPGRAAVTGADGYRLLQEGQRRTRPRRWRCLPERLRRTHAQGVSP